MKKLTCKITFNHIFENLISSSFRDIHLIEIIEVLKENIAKGENIGISKITLKDNKPISELKFSKFFKIVDVIEKNSNEYICLVKVSIPEKFSNLLKWLDLEILWDRPIIMTEKSVEYSCIGSEKNLKKILKFSNILGKITAISYKEANYNKYNFLSNLTPKEEKIMIMAIKYGYYEYPRKINATKLAKMQKNSKSTVIEHLRKAENKVILSILENQVNGINMAAKNETAKTEDFRSNETKFHKHRQFSEFSSEMKIKILKNGPYLVSGGIPLLEQIITTDEAGHTRELQDVMEYPSKDRYTLCRCGASKNKPYCDGTHNKIDFDGAETASRKPYIEKAEIFEGNDLKLTDAHELCDHSRFCLRSGGIRDLIKKSDDPEARQTAIEEAMICPSGRLVLWDKKTGEPFEKEFEPSIVMVHDKQKGCEGPIWVRGGIPVESADGSVYEVRNRQTLCRCGKSENKPYCDGSHWMNSEEKIKFRRKWGLDEK